MNKESIAKMQELTQKACQENKILHVSEAFIMYSVEEEPHNGQLEYWGQGAE